MNLEAEFKQSLEQRFEGIKSKKILLAVSGGPDSIALLYLFAGVSTQLAVAHCNFGLRAADSDADELCVKQHCSQLGIMCYTKRFETKEYAKAHSLSIQLAARELRYTWFEQLRHEHQFDYVATAHHIDDNVETVLMNMLRGAGMKGLAGIPEQNEKIIRPLLFANKEQLITFLNRHHIVYRIDASNNENKYTRNKLRNTIIPQLIELNPQAVDHIHQLSQHAQFAQALISEKIRELVSLYVTESNDSVQLQYHEISKLPFAVQYLYELVSLYGFNPTQCEGIHTGFNDNKTGSRFLSETHELIINRHTLIITPIETPTISDEIILHKLPSQSISLPNKQYFVELIDAHSINEYLKGHLYINADSLLFPLRCRVWKQGDSFKPLGNNGTQKISDLLINEKVSLAEKRSTFVLESAAGDIVAVLNHRISNNFKITPDTKSVLHISTKGDL